MTKLFGAALMVAMTLAYAGTAAAQQCNRPKPEASIAPTQTPQIQLALVMPAQQVPIRPAQPAPR